jgi:hypothetical protein
MVLKGHVVLDHGLGQMQAEEAYLERQEMGKDFPFSSIQLKKEVRLALQESASIVCEEALLDFTSLKGTLTPAEGGKVVYTDQISRKKGALPAPFRLESRHLDVELLKTSERDYRCDTLLAEQDVEIHYLELFHLFAHKALYRKEKDSHNKTSSREFQGVITAYPEEGGAPCTLIYLGKEITAAMVDIDLLHSKLSLLHPQGTLATSLAAGSLRFRSDYLYWDHNHELLTLKGGVHLEEDSIGELKAQDELRLTLHGQELSQLTTQGPSTLTYKDSNARVHKLSTEGPIQIDRAAQRASIEALPSHPLCYEGDTFTVFANEALIDYAANATLLEPSLITLKGDVRLSTDLSKEGKQLGCADRLSYSVTTRTFILSANPGKKVLFWDDKEGMHLAAPEVHITVDPVTHQQHVKGIGSVQFSFTSEEQHKLLKLFPELKK